MGGGGVRIRDDRLRGLDCGLALVRDAVFHGRLRQHERGAALVAGADSDPGSSAWACDRRYGAVHLLLESVGGGGIRLGGGLAGDGPFGGMGWYCYSLGGMRHRRAFAQSSQVAERAGDRSGGCRLKRRPASRGPGLPFDCKYFRLAKLNCYNRTLLMANSAIAPQAASTKKIILLRPRGFCAGVVRAIDVVKIALDLYGAPIYVRKEIVHNKHVVDELRAAGAIFIEELDEVPAGARVIFSAHGVSPLVRTQAVERDLQVIDATCPL